MKIGNLKSLGHNISDSLASGVGMLVGIYEMDIFAEASAADAGHIEVDFLTGRTTGSPISESLRKAIELYRKVVPDLASKHDIGMREIATLSAHFEVNQVYGPQFYVTVASTDGRKSVDLYRGIPGKRALLK